MNPARQIPAAFAFAALLPFTLTWNAGHCTRCRTAVELGHVEFLNRIEAFAVGSNHGTRGPGKAIVVHTADGGATWQEIPETAQDGGSPNGPPAFWYLDSDRGWVSASLNYEDPITVTTFDHGGHWIGVGSHEMRELRFFDETRGYGTEEATLLRTRDGGENWNQYTLPGVRTIDRMFFLNPDTGWLSGADGKTIYIARTTDAARTFQTTRAASPAEIDSIQDLFFLDPAKGWLIAWNTAGRGTRILATTDGGKTWTPLRDPQFQGPGRWATAIRFLTPKDGYIFEKSDNGARTLFWTSDAGLHWTPETLPHAVSDCQPFEGDLLCSAGEDPDGFNLLTLHLK